MRSMLQDQGIASAKGSLLSGKAEPVPMNLLYSRSLLGAAATLVAASPAFADVIIRSGVKTDLTDPAAWEGGAVPTLANDATWSTNSLMG